MATKSKASKKITIPAGAPQLVSTDVAAKMLDTTNGNLRLMRSQGLGPIFIRDGARIKYDIDDIRQYIAERRHVPSVRAALHEGQAHGL